MLDGDPIEIAERLSSDSNREPSWIGSNREKKFLDWLQSSQPDPSLPGTRIDVQGLSREELVRRVAAAFELTLK